MDHYVKEQPIGGLTGTTGGAGGLNFHHTASGGGNTGFYGARGIFATGYGDGLERDTIDYVSIDTTGNASDFGRLLLKNFSTAACSNQTRGVWMGGGSSPQLVIDVMQYVTISSTGDATDFGNTITTIISRAGCSDGSAGNRGLYWAGYPTSSGALGNVIGYITITSTGNATDFGDTLTNTGQGCAWADSTRGCFNGSDPSHDNSNVIQYVTIQSTGNATDFGDMVSGATKRAGTADATRGVISNGEGSSGKMNQIE